MWDGRGRRSGEEVVAAAEEGPEDHEFSGDADALDHHEDVWAGLAFDEDAHGFCGEDHGGADGDEEAEGGLTADEEFPAEEEPAADECEAEDRFGDVQIVRGVQGDLEVGNGRGGDAGAGARSGYRKPCGCAAKAGKETLQALLQDGGGLLEGG